MTKLSVIDIFPSFNKHGSVYALDVHLSWEESIINPILQMKKGRITKIKWDIQNHTVCDRVSNHIQYYLT